MQCSKTDKSAQEAVQELCAIVSRLRGEEGCPWDRAQTQRTLMPCMIDETAEVLAAVSLYERYSDAENFCEELGDLLFLVVLQSQIAKEQGLFDFTDVVQKINEKMIRRHPHVFGEKNGTEKNPGWEEIKRQEKGTKDESFLEEQKRALRTAQEEMIRRLQREAQKGEN